VNGAGLDVDFSKAGGADFCSLREENPVLNSGVETLLKLPDVVTVVFVDVVLGVPNAGIVPLASKLKLGVVVADPKLGSDGDVMVVVVKGPNGVTAAVLVTDTKLGAPLFDIVPPTDSLLLTWKLKLKVDGAAVVFSAVPNTGADPEVVTDS
jgi:hypothetical protein